jgi:hypothetical protein
MIMISQILGYSAVAFALNYTKSSSAIAENPSVDKNIGSYFFVEDWPHGANNQRVKDALQRFGKENFDEIGKYVVSRQVILQQEYSHTIEKGVSLLKEFASDRDRVITFDFANPFPVLLGWEPPTGDRVGLYYGRTFNDEVHIPADDMFRDATVVMVPKTAIEPDTRDGLLAIYGPYLRAHFQLIHEDRYWSLWTRKGSVPDAVQG